MFLIDKNHMKRIVFLLILVLQFSFVNSQENELFHRVKINYNSSENFEKLLNSGDRKSTRLNSSH